jgi:hypothetical protein
MTKNEALILFEHMLNARLLYEQTTVSHNYDEWLAARHVYYTLRQKIVDALTTESEA